MHNFDAQWYLNNYKDVELSGMDPYQHYQKIGKLMVVILCLQIK